MAVSDPAGNIKPDKSKSTERIDGIAALVNAIERKTGNDPRPVAYSISWI
jgi:phage terminase large subunit-like protein